MPLRARIRRDLREVVLIIVGVLVALGANSWWQQRQERAAERRILTEMRSTLAVDLASVRQSLAGLRAVHDKVARLRAALRARPAYADSLDALLGEAYQTGETTVPNAAVYETLKARGLDLVSDDSLRYQISYAYETGRTSLAWANQFNDATTLGILRPYYLAHFRNLRFGQNATPLDYGAVLRDPYFENILYYREDTLGRSILPMYADAVRDDSALLARIDRYLAR